MRINSVIFLISLTSGSNDIGDPIEIEGNPRKLFAEKISIRQSEFYQAAATRYKPEISFKIWSKEYKDEEKLDYKGTKYTIFRTFSKGEYTELICSRVENGVS